MTESPTLPVAHWPVLNQGEVWLCGAGPGDAGLLTLHALNGLHQADTIVHDALVHDDILTWGTDSAKRINVGKRGGQSASQEEITALLVDLARQGKKVLRLKGGDPYVFGRGAEEAETLRDNGIPFRVIPGISAGIGGMSYAGIPVTHRDINQSVTFVTGHDIEGKTATAPDWTAIANSAPTIVIYMGLRNMGKIAARLVAAGRPADDPVAIVSHASTEKQTVLETTLGQAAADIAAAKPAAPAVICVGRAALLRQKLDWFGR
jgi:uroporphyrin-III C-methyltransferase